MLVKDEGIIAGLDIASLIFERIDPGLGMEFYLQDGDRIKPGDTGFMVSGIIQSYPGSSHRNAAAQTAPFR